MRSLRVRIGLSAVVVAAAAVVASPADARRSATPAERTLFSAAVLKWEKQDRTQDSLVGPANWAAKQRCHYQRAYVSTVNTRWGLYWLASKYEESDPRYAQCTKAAGYVEGVWVLKRSSSGAWAVTGWIWGERSGYCAAIAATGIPLAAFKDAQGFLPFGC